MKPPTKSIGIMMPPKIWCPPVSTGTDWFAADASGVFSGEVVELDITIIGARDGAIAGAGVWVVVSFGATVVTAVVEFGATIGAAVGTIVAAAVGIAVVSAGVGTGAAVGTAGGTAGAEVGTAVVALLMQ